MQRVNIVVVDSEEVGGWILSSMLDATDISVGLKRDGDRTLVVNKNDANNVIGRFPEGHPFNKVDTEQLQIMKQYVLGNPSSPLHPHLSLDIDKKADQ